MTTKDVLEALARGRAQLVESLDALGPAATSLPVTEQGWTAKDLFALFIHHAGDVTHGLGADLKPPAYVLEGSPQLSLEEWHDRAVRYWKAASLANVRAEFDQVLDALVGQVQKRSDDQMDATDAMPWAGDRPLWQIIGGETFLNLWPTYGARIDQARASR